jgi:hypothetical protein
MAFFSIFTPNRAANLRRQDNWQEEEIAAQLTFNHCSILVRKGVFGKLQLKYQSFQKGIDLRRNEKRDEAA